MTLRRTRNCWFVEWLGCLEGPLLVVAAAVGPLMNQRAVARRVAAHVQAVASRVNRCHPKITAAGRGEGELLVVVAQVIPQLHLGAIADNSTADFNGSAAGDTNDRFLVVATVGH